MKLKFIFHLIQQNMPSANKDVFFFWSLLGRKHIYWKHLWWRLLVWKGFQLILWRDMKEIEEHLKLVYRALVSVLNDRGSGAISWNKKWWNDTWQTVLLVSCDPQWHCHVEWTCLLFEGTSWKRRFGTGSKTLTVLLVLKPKFQNNNYKKVSPFFRGQRKENESIYINLYLNSILC